ncbi:MAG: hypothetical protein KF844_01125 [Cryobacterium sp.]|nr:hypothetical protein [Cryobacterium sp.]
MTKTREWVWLIAAVAGASTIALIVWLVATTLPRVNSEPEAATPSASSPAEGNDAGAGLPVGSHSYSMLWDGQERTYRVFVPRNLPESAPLVVMLHGGGGSGEQAEKSYGWDRLAQSQGFVVAYPDGLGEVIPAWNVDGPNGSDPNCCGQSGRTGVDDVGFVSQVVKTIQSKLSIDPNRIYAAGMSNGAILSYTLACETDIFAAIGPTSGTMLTSCDNPSPVSVIHIHGLQDTNIPFDGSKGEGVASIDGPPVEDVISAWRSTDQCDSPTTSSHGVVTTSIATCPDGRAVELITIADAEHGWPGAPLKPDRPSGVKHQPSQALDATQTIWDFFEAHPKS